MRKYTRSLSLDICDYDNNIVCNLYDNHSDVSGQAVDVFVSYSRNGWKELTFTIPSVCQGEDGEEENYRLKYLVADYRIRLKDDYQTDWYIISEPRIVHDAFSKNVEVRAGHICQLLKGKNLNLEFSDEEGNNVGTPSQLLATILEGTGWYVGRVNDSDFTEDDGTLKYRSLTASAKTGAFKMIEDMCDLFDAKPEYWVNDDGVRYVDIYPMNPFSKTREGEIPEKILDPNSGIGVLEINYNVNAHSISKTENTDNIVTKFYAFGSYGDMNGLCDISTCEHEELTFTIDQSYSAGQEFEFTDSKGRVWFFKIDDDITTESTLIWSSLDFASMAYVWNEDEEKAYHTYIDPITYDYVVLSYESETKQNYVTSLMDFDYYIKTGLLTEEMFQKVAAYQREVPELYEDSLTKAKALNNAKQELSDILESQKGFLRLNVTSLGTGLDNSLKLICSETDEYPEGIMYRTDYDERRENYFRWYVATQLKDNGDPVQGIGSIVLMVHNTDPVTWEKIYVKAIYDKDGNLYEDDDHNPKDFDYKLDESYPLSIDLWTDRSSIASLRNGDRFYLFSTNSMTGDQLGVLLSQDETFERNLNSETKQGTIEHPVYFVDSRNQLPAPTTLVTNTDSGYGWLYKYYATWTGTDKYKLGELYFCRGERGETTWNRVYIQDEIPSPALGCYLYSPQYNKLYRCDTEGWVYLDSYTEKNEITKKFVTVIQAAQERDMAYHGVYEKYTYPTNSLPVGNYAFKSPYDFYWTFSLAEPVTHSIYFKTTNKLLYEEQNTEMTAKVVNVLTSSIVFPTEGLLTDVKFYSGALDITDGTESAKPTPSSGDTWYRSNNIKVYEKLSYAYKGPSGYILFYDINGRFISTSTVTPQCTVTTPEYVSNARIVIPSEPGSQDYFRVDNYQSKIFIANKPYTILDDAGDPQTTLIGDNLLGINRLMRKFANLADELYLQILPAQKAAQDLIGEKSNELTDTLGEIIREGYWQENNYTEGSEDKLYKDALENLEKLAVPETSYSFTFLDLYGSNQKSGYAADEEETEWPDIKITDAVHLIDSDISTNCWAYIDTLNKCYDQPWKTNLEINTQLTLMSQHEFTDVLAKIADIAKTTNSNQSLYKRASMLSNSGLNASKLEGAIEANNTVLLGGASNWYTDNKGNIIFEAVDGNSALMITGAGMSVANTKDKYGDWEWRNAITGLGITADVITAGTINADLIAADSITANKLSPDVGETLTIANNPTISGINATISLLPDSIISRVEQEVSLKPFISATDPTLNPDNHVKEGDYWIKPVSEIVGGVEKTYNLYYCYHNLDWIEISDPQKVESAYTQVTQNTNYITAHAEDINSIGEIKAAADEASLWVQTNGGYFSEVKAGTQGVAAVSTNPNGSSHITVQGDEINLGSSGKIVLTSAQMIQIGGTAQNPETLASKLAEINTSLNDLDTELAGKGTMTSAVQEFTTTTSPSIQPSDSAVWSTTAPAWANNQYIWMRTKITSGSQGTISYLPTNKGVCISGAHGQDGTNGRDGVDGTNAYNTATITLYMRSSSTPTVLPGSLTYNFANASITENTTGALNGWSRSVPSGENPCYSISVYIATQASTFTINSGWSNPVQVMHNGADGTSISIVGTLNDPSQLPSSYSGNVGDCYLINGNLYVWNGTSWENAGNIQGPQGDPGTDGSSSYLWIRYSASSDGSSPTTTPTATTKYIGVGISNSSTVEPNQYTWSKYVGAGIQTVEDKYAISNSASTAPADSSSSWITTPQTPTEANPFLWNWEKVVDTEGNVKISVKRVIGNYSKDGKSISSITNKYLVTTTSTKPLKTASGWSINPPTLTSTNKYLWAYEITTYSEGNPTETDVCLIGVYGDKGETGNNGYNYAQIVLYKRGADATTAPALPTATLTYTFSTGALTPQNALNGWTTSMPSSNGYPCYAICYTAISDQQSVSITTASWSARNKVVEDGEDGADGNGILSVVTKYCWYTSPTTPPTAETDAKWGTDTSNTTEWKTYNYKYTSGTHAGEYYISYPPDDVTRYYFWTWTRINFSDGTKQSSMRSEYGVNASYDRSRNAEEVALGIVDGSHNAYLNAQVLNAGFKYYLDNGRYKIDIGSTGDMTIASGGAIYIVSNPSQGQAATNAVVMNDTGIALASNATLSLDASCLLLSVPGEQTKTVTTYISGMIDNRVSDFATESFVTTLADSIIAGVTPVEGLLTDGSYISIFQDSIDLSSSGSINLASGSELNLDGGVINVGNGADTGEINIASGGSINLIAGSSIDILTSASQGAGSLSVSTITVDNETYGVVDIEGAIINIGSDETTSSVNIVSGGEMNISGGSILVGNGGGVLTIDEDNGITIGTGNLSVAAENFIITNGGSSGESVTISTYIDGVVSTVAGGSKNYYQTSDPRLDVRPPMLHTGDFWIKPANATQTTWGDVTNHKWGDFKGIKWGEVAGKEMSLMWDSSKWVYLPDNILLEEINNISSKISQESRSIRLEMIEANTYLATELKSLIQSTASEILMRVESTERKTQYIQEDGKISLDAITESDAKNVIVKAGISLDADGKIGLEAMRKTIQDTIAAASMYLDTSGATPTIRLTAQNFKSLSGSGITITPTSIAISTSGVFSLQSTYFTVTTDGKITSTGGKIGGFTIGQNTLSAGSGSAYVHMSSSTSGWAFAAGKSDPSSAPFRVNARGEVYISKLMVKKTSSTWEEVNFSEFATKDALENLNKLQYNTVVSVSQNSLTYFDGSKSHTVSIG